MLEQLCLQFPSLPEVRKECGHVVNSLKGKRISLFEKTGKRELSSVAERGGPERGISASFGAEQSWRKVRQQPLGSAEEHPAVNLRSLHSPQKLRIDSVFPAGLLWKGAI